MLNKTLDKGFLKATIASASFRYFAKLQEEYQKKLSDVVLNEIVDHPAMIASIFAIGNYFDANEPKNDESQIITVILSSSEVPWKKSAFVITVNFLLAASVREGRIDMEIDLKTQSI